MSLANGVIRTITICTAVTIVCPGLYAQELSSTTNQESTSGLSDARSGSGANIAECKSRDISFVTGFETPAEYYRMQHPKKLGSNRSCQASSINFVWEFANPYEETMRAASAGLSSLTGEQTNGDAAYIAAYVERSDGSGYPGFGADEQRMLLYKMPSGKYVLRIIQDPPEKYWPGPQ